MSEHAAPTLSVVTDCRPTAGHGHIGRCLALSEAWTKARGTAEVVAAGGELPPEWRERYEAAGALRVDAAAVSGDVVVLDGYRWGPEFEAAAGRTSGSKLIIDDRGLAPSHEADWIVDQTLGASACDYVDRPGRCRLLLGPRYALVRRDIAAAWARRRPPTPAAPLRLLVAVGGSPGRELLELVDAVVADERLAGCEVVRLAGVTEVGALLSTVDLALTAAGTTCWDLCAAGVAMVAIAVAENQQPIARQLGQAGAAIDGGNIASARAEQLAGALAALAADSDARAEMATRGHSLVDGRGAERVATALRGGLIALRDAVSADAEQIFEWANDPLVRRRSFASSPISWEAHVEWFAGLLADQSRRLYLATDQHGNALGQARFELDARSGDARVGLSIAPGERGRGWGGPLVDAASRRAISDLADRGLLRLVATVKLDNEASRRAFVAADYDLQPATASDQAAQSHTYARMPHD